VQLYIRDEVVSLTRFMKKLRGFRRISLHPGQAQIVEFKLGFDALSFLNRDMKRTLEPGTFKITIGGDSVDLQEVTRNIVNIVAN
jgi:beta-glucosidase